MRNNKSIVIMKKTNSGGKKIINQNRVKTKSFVGSKKQTLNEVYKINKYEIIWPKTFRHKKKFTNDKKYTPKMFLMREIE